MKKIKLFSILSVLALSLSFSLIVPAFAATYSTSDEITIPSHIVAERVDVPISAALSDPTFSLTLNNENNLPSTAATGDVRWEVWGVKGYDSSARLYYPVGYSAHMDGTNVLSTYHYTRTFLGSTWDPRGDSGRVWGYKTVRANGTNCMQEVWDFFVHKVYYGLTSN